MIGWDIIFYLRLRQSIVHGMDGPILTYPTYMTVRLSVRSVYMYYVSMTMIFENNEKQPAAAS